MHMQDDFPLLLSTLYDHAVWQYGPQEIVSVEDAPAREAGEVIEDEGDAHERIVAFLDELKVL